MMGSKLTTIDDSVLDAIIAHKLHGLELMSHAQILLLPKKYICKCMCKELAWNWSRLPEKLKKDKDLQKYQFCLEHYVNNGLNNTDHIDGPPSQRYKCVACVQDKVLLEE